MKKLHISLLGFLFLWCVNATGWAQGLPVVKNAVRAGERISAQEGARATVTQAALTAAEEELLPVDGIVKYEMQYNPSQGSAMIANIQQQQRAVAQFTALPQSRLSPTLFPYYSKMNSALYTRIAQTNMERLLAVDLHSSFYSALRLNYFENAIPWERYLPSTLDDITYFYVGEMHENPLIYDTLLDLLHTLRRRYPSRKIYFATEYLPDTLFPAPIAQTVPVNILSNPRELEMIGTFDARCERFPFLRQISKDGFPIVGLEPIIQMQLEFEKEISDKKINEEDLGELEAVFTNSELSFTLRSNVWVNHLKELHAKDPTALIVVHGGAAHLNYWEATSVPRILPEKAFSILLLDERLDSVFVTPSLADLNKEVSLVQNLVQNEKTNGRYVLSLKQPDLTVGRTPEDLREFREGLGTDMAVIISPSKEETEITLATRLKNYFNQFIRRNQK